ncbi:uncharacterized protein PAC_16745 [Phialocephala subalpina]|uniref:Heterokaryon incompatibility domain-containing protein n=1 Tax=Phialocephala subalpina TaxID=576137 RepID=A0A1L7XP95_9HELO|nr:uncharacterized protein PAC_16745 [Phialocephala subalpina]
MKPTRNDQLSASEAPSKEPNPAPMVEDHNNHVLPGPGIDDDLESPLCDDCKQILAKFPKVQVQVEPPHESFHSTTKAKVEAQAANGCDLCRWFLKYGDLQENKELTCARQIEEGFDEQGLWLGGGHALLTKKLTIEELNEGANEGPYYRELPTAILKNLQLSPRFQTCVAQARHWLGNCASHSTCKPKPSYFLPKRLVCIDSSDPTILRLATRDNTPPDARYMTLSHCWGQSQPYRLLKDNYENVRTTINYHELPKNFQDAILVAWGLNISYLWIDSLCIIQDDLSDWQQESALMGEIYSHGQANICATGASDGDSGLFLDRQFPAFPNLNIKLRFADNEPARICHTADLGMWGEGVERSPLLLRAWVLQERILSRCNIHFSSTQMFWECAAGCTMETYTARFLSDTYTSISRKSNFSATDSFPTLKARSDGDLGQNKDDGDQEEKEVNKNWKVAELWNQVVESYSACALTNNTDRLIALSGIAAKYSTFLSTSFSTPGNPFIPAYFAGIWNHDMTNHLLWQRMSDESVSRPNIYIAPSWSWACIDRGIYNEIYSATILTLIFVLVSITPTTRTHGVASIKMTTTLQNPAQQFGQVTAGTLSLDTKMATGRIEKADVPDSYMLRFKGVEEPILVNWDARDSIMLVSDLDVDHSEASGRRVYFVPLRATVDLSTVKELDEDGKAPWREKELHGLMLVSADQETSLDGLPLRYQRIGRWMMWDSGCIEKLFAAMQCCEETYGDLMTEGCEEVKFFGNGDKAFRVDVI